MSTFSYYYHIKYNLNPTLKCLIFSLKCQSEYSISTPGTGGGLESLVRHEKIEFQRGNGRDIVGQLQCSSVCSPQRLQSSAATVWCTTPPGQRTLVKSICQKQGCSLPSAEAAHRSGGQLGCTAVSLQQIN